MYKYQKTTLQFKVLNTSRKVEHALLLSTLYEEVLLTKTTIYILYI